MSRTRFQRSYLYGGDAGRFTHEPSTGTGHDIEIKFDLCSDDPGPGDCGPLYVEHLERRGGIIDKPWSNYFDSWFTNYTCDWLRQPANGTVHLGVDTMDNYAAAAACAARTNPSRPLVDYAAALAELREVPDLFRRFSGDVIRRTADLNLRYQFGIRPLYGDILKLLFFQQQVGQRTRELQSLHGGSGLRRTVRLDDDITTGTFNQSVQSLYAYWPRDFTIETRERVWGHSRWSPDLSMTMSPADPRLSSIAAQAVRGLDVDISTAWQLMPWSWLADWFSNMGDVLMAHRNVVGAHLEGVAIMRQTTTITQCPEHARTEPTGAYMSPLYVRYEQKRRQMVPVILSASLPYLSNRQLGIASSLSITRRGR